MSSAIPIRRGSVEAYRPQHPVRIVTAASLFDGHDAAINIIRRLLQASGVEVIHLGHNRSVGELVDAAIQEDAQAVAVSSYQGGHIEFFKYLRDMLRERHAAHVRIFGGGGGTIIPAEQRELEDYGITRIFHAEDGRRLGLQGMINQIVSSCDHPPSLDLSPEQATSLRSDSWSTVARAITVAEAALGDTLAAERFKRFSAALPAVSPAPPVVGITGSGGAGKSSLTDELVRRFVEDFPSESVAILSVDPTKKRTGGALLGDRIRINALSCRRIYMRSMATRGSRSELSAALRDAIAICRAASFDLIVVETSGIGQADSAVVELADLSVYVMTPEFGAQTQLEKIEMIDAADLVVINKADKLGAEDALRDVRKAYGRARGLFEAEAAQLPVYAAVASQFNDRGTNSVYCALLEQLAARSGRSARGRFTAALEIGSPARTPIIPLARTRYLAEVAETVRGYKRWVEEQVELADRLWALQRTIDHLLGAAATAKPPAPRAFAPTEISECGEPAASLMHELNRLLAQLDARARTELERWPSLCQQRVAERTSYEVRGQTIEVENFEQTLSELRLPKVALPRFHDYGNVLRYCLLEHLPGHFPFTAGVFPFRRRGEDPTRMFAGEGGPQRTNRRFHYLCRHAEAKRLSTAFDSVTLYGEDPERQPDIWGKVGNSGVSIAHVEDMEALFAGFDLCNPLNSVSMTINGPAPTILAFYFNAAIRQQLRRLLKQRGQVTLSDDQCLTPDGGGYRFETLRAMVSDDDYRQLVDQTVRQIRGTVQADILKEDQAQNTCIFSTEFSLRLMGDVQSWFVEHGVRNFYSVSISGYHIAEAGANPITQLAFTLANGFTYVEYFRGRGLGVDDFAPNLSFFFSNGMDAEYSVIGRVARRIWSTAMRGLYQANERGQKLKYHIQTSGRSLHAQEIAFNDIRTTLQALLAYYDRCDSLHTNAYDEAITTPTEESVRRALAIQLIISREFGLARNQNPLSGSFVIDELTELVEEAVLAEFERLSERGGVLGAMERMYQRSKIQQESLRYEHLKHSGQLPLIGVNTFIDPEPTAETAQAAVALIRATDEEKNEQIARLADFHRRHAAHAETATQQLKQVALEGGNVFGALLEATQVLSLGQTTAALYQVGGRYRRAM